MAKCDFVRWIDPPHERHVVTYVDRLWNRIFELKARIDNLNEENDDLRATDAAREGQRGGREHRKFL